MNAMMIRIVSTTFLLMNLLLLCSGCDPQRPRYLLKREAASSVTLRLDGMEEKETSVRGLRSGRFLSTTNC